MKTLHTTITLRKIQRVRNSPRFLLDNWFIISKDRIHFMYQGISVVLKSSDFQFKEMLDKFDLKFWQADKNEEWHKITGIIPDRFYSKEEVFNEASTQLAIL